MYFFYGLHVAITVIRCENNSFFDAICAGFSCSFFLPCEHWFWRLRLKIILKIKLEDCFEYRSWRLAQRSRLENILEIKLEDCL